ncbi:MAG: TPP-binding protein, partial [Comamonadaceae bacterium]
LQPGADGQHHVHLRPQPVGHRLWPEVDVVLAIGTRLQTQQMVWGMDSRLKVIRIDADADEIERWAPPEIALCAQAHEVLPALAGRVAAQAGARADRADEIATHREAIDQAIAFLRPQLDFLQAIRETLPEDGLLVEEMTQVGYVSRFGFPVHRPRTFLSTGYQGTLGWGYATALGAKAALPHRAVVSLNGDGGFMFNVQELATAAQFDLGVIAIVFDDGGFGNVRRLQQAQFGDRPMACDLINPDFVRLAESFGVAGHRASTPEQLRDVLARAIPAGRPALVHVPVGTMPDPWKFLNLPRNRG